MSDAQAESTCIESTKVPSETNPDSFPDISQMHSTVTGLHKSAEQIVPGFEMTDLPSISTENNAAIHQTLLPCLEVTAIPTIPEYTGLGHADPQCNGLNL